MRILKQFVIPLTTLTAIILSYLFFDQKAVWWVRDHVSYQDHEKFTTVTQFGDSTYYLIGLTLAFFVFRYLWKKPKWESISLFLFASVAVSGIITDIFKVIAGRHRPSELLVNGTYGFDFFHIDRAMTSFPSGHTTTAFALAVAISYLWPKLTVPMWSFAVLIGISRLAIAAHYPSDVIAGAYVGVFSTFMLIGYWNRSKWFENKPLH